MNIGKTMDKRGFEVGDKVRRIKTKKTRTNPHPVKTIWRFYHSGGIDFVVFKDSGAMSCVGLKYYEKVDA